MPHDFPKMQEYHIQGVMHVLMTEAKSMIAAGNALLVDVREQDEVMNGRPELGTAYLHCPLSAFMQYVDGLPTDKTLIIMCAHGIRSIQVTAWFRQHGREDVLNLAGGFEAYRG